VATPAAVVFRTSPLALLAVFALTICATPVAWGARGLQLVYLLPIGLAVWVLRVRTTADDQTVVARDILRTRRVSWSDISALRLRSSRMRPRISAMLSDGSELPLPAVHVRDLPMLAAASGGRLPDPSAPPAMKPAEAATPPAAAQETKE